MSTREILTLQIGHYSNFVGSHIWNIQVSIMCSLNIVKVLIKCLFDYRDEFISDSASG